MKVSLTTVLGAAALIYAGAVIISKAPSNTAPGFVKADIKAMKESIRTEFEKREGIEVVEVEMIRESDTKATGFVKLKTRLLGEIMKSCSATMELDSNRYIWRCE